MDPVRRQYETYPYPERDPAEEAKRLIEGSPSAPREIDHFLFRGRRDWRKPFRALVAGGGTGDGLIQLAAKLKAAGCPADITYVDMSQASREIAEARAEARGLDPDALFAFARCELNGVAPPELLALGRAAATCAGPAPAAPSDGAGPCGLWILSRTADGWLELLETVGAPRLAASSTNGWTDILAGAGPRPTVFKFDGDSYAADLGEDALTLDALEEYGAPLDGALQVIWFSVEDDMPDVAARVFLWFWEQAAIAASGELGALPDEFRVGLAPIVPDAAPAVAIQGLSSRYCSAEGCEHWIFRPAGEGDPPRLTAQFKAFDLNLADSGAYGHRDLVVTGISGPQVWRHDGRAYGHAALSRPLQPGEAAALAD